MDREKRHIQAQITALTARMNALTARMDALEARENSDEGGPFRPTMETVDASSNAGAVKPPDPLDEFGPSTAPAIELAAVEEAITEEFSKELGPGHGLSIVHQGFGRYQMFEHGNAVNAAAMTKASMEELFKGYCEEHGLDEADFYTVVEDRFATAAEGADA